MKEIYTSSASTVQEYKTRGILLPIYSALVCVVGSHRVNNDLSLEHCLWKSLPTVVCQSNVTVLQFSKLFFLFEIFKLQWLANL